MADFQEVSAYVLVKNRKPPEGGFLFLVEAGRVELPSENLSIRLSPGAVGRKCFPKGASPDGDALAVSPLFMTAAEEIHRSHLPLNDALHAVAVIRAGRAALRRLLLTCCCQRLI